jgi:hypothetical protein
MNDFCDRHRYGNPSPSRKLIAQGLLPSPRKRTLAQSRKAHTSMRLRGHLQETPQRGRTLLGRMQLTLTDNSLLPDLPCAHIRSVRRRQVSFERL